MTEPGDPPGDGPDSRHRTLRPVGVVRSCFGEKFGTPRQPGLAPSARSELIFEPAFRDPSMLRGIEGFSHLWLIFGFHLVQGEGGATVRPPRLGGNERVGVFASRSPFRPNGLGLSLVRLEGVVLEGHGSPRLILGGADLVDGTPVFDIKPYLPYAECVPDATGGFAGKEIDRLSVTVDPSAKPTFDSLDPRDQATVVESLALDPRPAVQASDGQREFGVWMCGHNIRFVISDGSCLIIEIQPHPRP